MKDKPEDITNHLKALILSLEDIIFELDGHKTFKNVWVSDEKILFMPIEKFIGKTISEVFGPGANIFNHPVDKVLKTGELVEFEYKHIDNSINKWYKAKIKPFIKDNNPSIYRMVMSIQDITVQRKQAQALKEANERLEQSNFLLDVTQELGKVAGWEFDLKTEKVYFTKQAYLLYEVDTNFIPTIENTRAFFETEARNKLDECVFNAIEERTQYKIELPIITAKNNKKWVRSIGIPIIVNGEVVGLKGAVLDITEEKEAELALIKIKEKLEASNKDKDRIMQVLVHDLRSPLSGIYSIAEMMLANNRFSDKNKEMLKLITDSSLSAHDMVNDLIDAFVNNNKIKHKNENISDLIYRCVEINKHRATKKQQNIVLTNNEPIFVLIDLQKIERVINNLINNAIKFSPNNSEISIEIKQIKQNVEISIKDKGIGIPDELKNIVFDMLGKAKRYGTSGERPFGLGLFICKQIIEEHCGKIWFESETNKGTTFFILLPLGV